MAAQELFRLATCGSVDDGKSTLIGRLLYECKQLTQDQLDAIERWSAVRGKHQLDLSLLTDGLREERERGITIDVAYRYFETPKRKFILADTPGHFEYTRNMFTGASLADAVLILIDATQGIKAQTRLHAQICALLRPQHIVVCMNKMDRLAYNEASYLQLVADFKALPFSFSGSSLHFIPLSALEGQNLVSQDKFPWYSGPSLIELLETMPLLSPEVSEFRASVQVVASEGRLLFAHAFGRHLHPAESVVVLPQNEPVAINALTGLEALTIELSASSSAQRGNVLVSVGHKLQLCTKLKADVCCLHENGLTSGTYLIQLAQQRFEAYCQFENEIPLNEFGTLQLESNSLIVADCYTQDKHFGSLLIIDPISFETLAAACVYACGSK
ncbi:MAG: bifunctional enzyme CysN/CysC [Bacteroidota bacterium]|jgi:sulfate adenylyltransferase subunit 1 (EFTu-like GTPase family)